MDNLNYTIDYNYGSNITEDITLIQDLEEIGLTELETVVIACLATVVPLLIIFGLGLLLKLCIDRCMKRKTERYQGYLTQDDSRQTEEMKTSESQFSVLPPEELHDIDGAYGFSGGGASRPNGISIITINMKNNHLIVETEEPVSGIIKPPSSLSPFSYATSTTSKNPLIANTSGGTTYMVDIVEEQDTEPDDLLDINGPFMSNQEYYKYNKSKYEATRGGEDINTTCVDLTHHNHEAIPSIDLCNDVQLKDFQSELYERNVEDVFKRSLSDSVDNEEVLSREILDSKNEALNYQRMLSDNQMFLKDIKTMHDARLIQQDAQINNCDSTDPSYSVSGYETCDCKVSQPCNDYSVHPPAHIKQEVKVNTSPGIYDYACNCSIPHTIAESYEEVNIPDIIQHSHTDTAQMSSQCILENYQNMYNDIRLGQVTSGFSQCDTMSGENEYYRYGNQMEYYPPDSKPNKSGLPEELVHLELQKRLGNGLRTPSA